MESFPGNARGKGPRGISINHPQINGILVYRFDINPHNISAYNKNPTQLYEKAALAFAEVFSKNGCAPEDFCFKTYGENFQAALQSS